MRCGGRHARKLSADGARTMDEYFRSAGFLLDHNIIHVGVQHLAARSSHFTTLNASRGRLLLMRAAHPNRGCLGHLCRSRLFWGLGRGACRQGAALRRTIGAATAADLLLLMDVLEHVDDVTAS